MKKTIKVFFFVILVLITLSCRREDLSITQILSQPYMKSNGEMGLSLYLKTSLSDTEKSTLLVTDPSGSLSWTVSLKAVEYQGTKYFGTSDISMPQGNLLPTGDWKVELIYKDGRTVSETVSVNYKDAQNVIDRVSSETKPYYDVASNLTCI